MTPRALLRGLFGTPPAPDAEPGRTRLRVAPGETVGVVLMNTGGPSCPDDVEPFVYSRLMDPSERRWPVPVVLRRIANRVRARRHARDLTRAYELIGGASPLAHHTREQGRLLGRRLNERFGAATGAQFRIYTAMRHGHPSSQEAADAMTADGVDHVVLLPLHPHYTRSTTGSSLAAWAGLDTPAWPTARVLEYAAHPKYIQAVAERVDEGLQRFPREVRHRVQVVFCAQGALQAPADRERDPYCCLVHATVQHVVTARAARDAGRGVHVAFAEPLGAGRALGPDVRTTLEAIADDGHDAVLVVPVSFVSDRIETAYVLDVRVREEAAEAGIAHFEVSNGLNGHPLLVDALAECVVAQLAPPDSQGDGASGALLAPALLPRHDPALRTVRCADCTFVAEPCEWPAASAPDAVPDVAA